MAKRINACIEQHFRCLTYCNTLFDGDVTAVEDCQEFCDGILLRCVTAALQEVNTQIDNLVAIRTALQRELATVPPSKARLFDLLTQLAAQASALAYLVQIESDLTGDTGGPTPDGSGSSSPAPNSSRPRKARKRRRRT